MIGQFLSTGLSWTYPSAGHIWLVPPGAPFPHWPQLGFLALPALVRACRGLYALVCHPSGAEADAEACAPAPPFARRPGGGEAGELGVLTGGSFPCKTFILRSIWLCLQFHVRLQYSVYVSDRPRGPFDP